MPQNEKVRLALPEDLTRQFSALRNRLFSLESLFAGSIAFSALLLSFFLLFISDRFWDTPIWLRLFLLLAAVTAVGSIAFWWIQRYLIHPRDLRALAHLVQHKYRRLGDRLLGIVELADEKSRPAYFSAELYEAAIAQVSTESSKYDFTAAVDPRRSRVQLWITCALILLALLPLLFIPKAGWNSLCRWLMPSSKIPRFTLVELASVPHEEIVPHGEKFTVSGKVLYRSFWHPHQIKAEIAGQPAIFSFAKDGAFSVEVPGQIQDGELFLRAGDTTAAVNVKARHRPGIQSVLARVELPAYLKYPAQEENIQGGVLSVVEGSTVSIEAKTTRELKGAEIAVDEQKAQAVSVIGNQISTPKFPVNGVSAVTFNWQDTLDLTNASPWRLAVQVQKDAAPIPEIAELYRDTAILETEVLPITTRARDDYGVKTVGLNWTLENAESSTNNPVQKEFAFDSATGDSKTLEQTFNFSPAVFRIPPESTIEIQAFAVDFLPGRERAETPVYRIHVLGNAHHAEMIRQNLESLLVHLEEVSRLEEKIASETREMKDLQKLDTPEAGKKAAQLEQEQDRNSSQLQEIASEGMKTLREALRNPAFNEEMLTKWTKDLHEMQKLAQEQMKDAANALKQASQNQPSQNSQSEQSQSQAAQQREEQLSEAFKKEQEVVQALQKMQKKVNEGLDELQALTLSERLRQLGGTEKKLEGHLQGAIQDTIGLSPQELPPRYQKANSQLSGVQNETQGTSAKLQGEISRFFERTQKPNYGEVGKEMTESRTVEELDRLRGLIQDNVGMEAMQNLAAWAEKFNAWADKLEPKGGDEGGGSGSGQSGGENKDDAALKQLLALLRMREKQLNIQHRTKILDGYSDDKTTYDDGAVLLAASQAKLNGDLTKQAVGNPYAALENPYNDAITVMTDVETLLDKPRTDQVTHKAQDKSLSMLTDLINLLNEQAKKSNNSSGSSNSSESSSEQMAFLMQMMAPQMTPGMQAGQKPGGNMNGGTTDRTGSSLTGDAEGRTGESRSVKKSSGLPQNYPTEFRQALENYFKAIEQNGK